MSEGPGVEIRLPDGSTRRAGPNTRAGELLGPSGEGPRPLAASLDGRPVDLSAPLTGSGTLVPLTFATPAGREVLHHSAAHLVAKALTECVPEALPTAGPPTEEGFYYDFDVRPLTADDLAKIRERIAASIAAREPFERVEMSRSDALAAVAGNRHKVRYIEESPEGEPISFYRTGGFLDLCRGPHVPDTGWLAGLYILGVSAITAGGTPEGEPRQRIRGVAFPTKAELDAYLKMRAEAEARDHRLLGQRLGLFHFEEEAPGCPFWLPNGMIVVRELERFVAEHFRDDGYQEIRTPLLYGRSVFETSGHWDHYRENMFLSEAEGRTFVLKPMNCPGAMLIFRSRARSYRELPMRLAEFAPLHRFEPSGTLHGLTRVREFVQDDAHIFVSEEQVESEVRALLEWVRRAFSTFKLTWSYELSTRPKSFLGEAADWDRAEATLRSVLEASGVPFSVSAGEGAFYGPKIDIHIRDSLGRPWQTGTIQLDYQIPRRFRLDYQGADGQLHTPIVIHRTILGTWERFLGVLLEHCAGRLPPWLAPLQLRILPIADRHVEAARALASRLADAGVRCDSPESTDTLSKRVRDAELERIPYVVVLGDNEVAQGTAALRITGTKGQRSLSQSELLELLLAQIRSRSYDP